MENIDVDDTALPPPAERVVSASADIQAPASEVFELIANPARQPEWDGNDNLDHAVSTERITGEGQSFVMMLTTEQPRENHVVAFEEGRLIAWKPSEVNGEAFGQTWQWQVEPAGPNQCRVTHTYDWKELTHPRRIRRALSTTQENLMASLQHLKEAAERS